MMRALVVLALAAAAAAGAGTDSVNLGAGGGEPTPVKDGDKLRAALTKGDPVVELWDDILLDGAPAVATHDVTIEGNDHVLYQTGGARHFVSNGTRLELKNVQLKTGGHPSPAPTCSPTSPDATVAPTLQREAPLTLGSSGGAVCLHTRRSPRSRHDARRHGTDLAARAWERAPDHNWH